MHVRRQLIHIPKDGHPGIGHASPAGHLNHQGTSGVLHDVASVDGQGGQAEEWATRPIRCKVHYGAEGVASPSVVHVGHDGAQVSVLGQLHLDSMQCQTGESIICTMAQMTCMIANLGV